MNTEYSEMSYVHDEGGSPAKKFDLIRATSIFQPVERAEKNFDLIAELSADCSGVHDVRHKIYFSVSARKKMFAHIHWGEYAVDNRVEQGGILVGHACKDSSKGVIYGLVREAIPGTYARGSKAYLQIDHQAWKDMVDKVDAILDRTADKGLQIIGWYHTHPEGLGVFMSGTDRATQRRIFSQEWQFAVVLNPQKRHWRAFYGEHARECQGFMMHD